MTTTATPLAAYNIAAQLLACASDQVADTWEGNDEVTLGRECVVWGDIAWDDCDCGQLVVSIADQFPSNNFPTPATAAGPNGVTQDRCGAHLWVITYVISIVRCMPTQQDNGQPPTCEELDAAAQIATRDAWAVKTGVACCLHDLKTERLETGGTEIERYQINGQPSVGPQGACGGSVLNVQVGIRNCNCPPLSSS